ncbi:D-alanyl-D-alanine carboxypeptidase, partial [Mycobacterium sp. ITM-2017-0098]
MNPALKPMDATSFRALVERLVADLKVPGAMVVIRSPQGTIDAAVGTTDLAARTPPDATTHFRIASNT